MKNFFKGEYVVEYVGELINIKTAIQREDKYSKDRTKGCYMYYFKYKEKRYW